MTSTAATSMADMPSAAILIAMLRFRSARLFIIAAMPQLMIMHRRMNGSDMTWFRLKLLMSNTGSGASSSIVYRAAAMMASTVIMPIYSDFLVESFICAQFQDRYAMVWKCKVMTFS